jgi:hypothetical protein
MELVSPRYQCVSITLRTGEVNQYRRTSCNRLREDISVHSINAGLAKIPMFGIGIHTQVAEQQHKFAMTLCERQVNYFTVTTQIFEVSISKR